MFLLFRILKVCATTILVCRVSSTRRRGTALYAVFWVMISQLVRLSEHVVVVLPRLSARILNGMTYTNHAMCMICGHHWQTTVVNDEEFMRAVKQKTNDTGVYIHETFGFTVEGMPRTGAP